MLFVEAVFNQVVNDRWICKRGCVAKALQFVLGEFAQNAPHDFSGAGLRQTWRPLQQIDPGDRTNLGAHLFDQLVTQFITAGFTSLIITI